MTARRSPRTFILAVTVWLLGTTVLGAAQRVVAVGDVHGNFDGLVSILGAAGLIDDDLHWCGGDATFVQTGDILDRGVEVRRVMDLLMRLQSEAATAGGELVPLLGNHEGMNLLGILRDVNPGVYTTFADRRSKRRQREAFERFREFWSGRVAGDADFDAIEKQWYASRPEGFLEYVAALATDGEYGPWLRSLRVAVVRQDTLFIHAGVGPAVADLGVAAMNHRVAEELTAFDLVRSWAARRGLALPHASIYELEQAVESLKGEEVRAEDQELERWIDMVRGWQKWLLVDPEGPLWTRDPAMGDDATVASELEASLPALGVSRMVVGHTPQRSGRITERGEGRVLVIDTGMLESVYHGRPSALEIDGETITAIYEDRREVLVFGSSVAQAPPPTPVIEPTP